MFTITDTGISEQERLNRKPFLTDTEALTLSILDLIETDDLEVISQKVLNTLLPRLEQRGYIRRIS